MTPRLGLRRSRVDDRVSIPAGPAPTRPFPRVSSQLAAALKRCDALETDVQSERARSAATAMAAEAEEERVTNKLLARLAQLQEVARIALGSHPDRSCLHERPSPRAASLEVPSSGGSSRRGVRDETPEKCVKDARRERRRAPSRDAGALEPSGEPAARSQAALHPSDPVLPPPPRSLDASSFGRLSSDASGYVAIGRDDPGDEAQGGLRRVARRPGADGGAGGAGGALRPSARLDSPSPSSRVDVLEASGEANPSSASFVGIQGYLATQQGEMPREIADPLASLAVDLRRGLDQGEGEGEAEDGGEEKDDDEGDESGVGDLAEGDESASGARSGRLARLAGVGGSVSGSTGGPTPPPHASVVATHVPSAVQEALPGGRDGADGDRAASVSAPASVVASTAASPAPPSRSVAASPAPALPSAAASPVSVPAPVSGPDSGSASASASASASGLALPPAVASAPLLPSTPPPFAPPAPHASSGVVGSASQQAAWASAALPALTLPHLRREPSAGVTGAASAAASSSVSSSAPPSPAPASPAVGGLLRRLERTVRDREALERRLRAARDDSAASLARKVAELAEERERLRRDRARLGNELEAEAEAIANRLSQKLEKASAERQRARQQAAELARRVQALSARLADAARSRVEAEAEREREEEGAINRMARRMDAILAAYKALEGRAEAAGVDLSGLPPIPSVGAVHPASSSGGGPPGTPRAGLQGRGSLDLATHPASHLSPLHSFSLHSQHSQHSPLPSPRQLSSAHASRQPSLARNSPRGAKAPEGPAGQAAEGNRVTLERLSAGSTTGPRNTKP